MSAMPWTPPRWLEKLHAVANEPVPAHWRRMSPAERLALAFDLMSFGLDRLHAQARERNCTVSELLRRYDEAAARLRTRG